ncbi:MAG: hypothetical protein JO007_17495 [Alphaproteobacteria bacterium]|nr:hypothetical protein [Alphaproteobacteria bacterium]
MTGLTHDTELIRHAVEYVAELYRELSEENGAPTPGTQNQVVNFILADPALSRAVRAWGERTRADEATAGPPQRLPFDETYRRVEAFMRSVMERPVFARKDQD